MEASEKMEFLGEMGEMGGKIWWKCLGGNSGWLTLECRNVTVNITKYIDPMGIFVAPPLFSGCVFCPGLFISTWISLPFVHDLCS